MPLQEIIYRVLQLKNGISTDKELYEAVNNAAEVSYSEFLKTIMKMELYGLLKTSLIKEDVLSIELNKES
ncbi:hypothetical protein [Fervidicoccus fontis]|uniref:hypothetical protein n=1 Tax=Fervidicoccus fontis TaxID=683846 RepID=UPI0011E55D7E|nr:hypothetical protein [Fervidicoccus fontis]